jgi:hypothetical protein
LDFSRRPDWSGYFIKLLLCRIVAHLLRNIHRAEMRAAHQAEMGKLRALLWECFVVKLARKLRVKRKVELDFPSKFKPLFRQRIVSRLRDQMAFESVLSLFTP